MCHASMYTQFEFCSFERPSFYMNQCMLKDLRASVKKVIIAEAQRLVEKLLGRSYTRVWAFPQHPRLRLLLQACLQHQEYVRMCQGLYSGYLASQASSANSGSKHAPSTSSWLKSDETCG